MLLSSAQGWTINYPFPLVLGLSALCMCSLTSGFQGEVTQTLLFKHPGVESNDLPLSSLLWLRGAASRCGKCSRPRPLLVQCSGHAEARGGGRLRVHLCRKSTLVAAGAGWVLAPLSSRLPVSARGAYPRFHVASRSTRSAPGGPPAPSQRGAGRGCGAGGTSDSALLARRLHGAQCHSAERAVRTVRRGPPALSKRCPPSLSLSQSQATDHPSPRPRGHLAAVNAETMDAGAAPQKHSRCRSCCCRRRAGAGRRAGAPLLLARVGDVPREGAHVGPSCFSFPFGLGCACGIAAGQAERSKALLVASGTG